MTDQTSKPKQQAPTPTPQPSQIGSQDAYALPQRLSDILHLQRTVGNRQTQRLLDRQASAARPPVAQGNFIPAGTIQRRLKGTASTLSFISEGSGKLLLKDTWKKLVEAVQEYEKLEDSQKTGGNRKHMAEGFEKLSKQLQEIRKLAGKWMADNQANTTQERQAYAQNEFPKIVDNATVEKSNKATAARNQGRPADQQMPLDPLAPVAPEGTLSQQMGAVKSLLVRLTIEEQQVATALRDPLQNVWLEQTEIYSDSTPHAVTDNAVGGAMNKLDQGTWTQNFTNKADEGFFIKDKSQDPLITGTGAEPIGIPQFDPNYSGRSLAMGRIDQLIDDKVMAIKQHVDPNQSPMLVKMAPATHRRETARGSNQFETKTGIFSEKAKGGEFRSQQVETNNVALNSANKGATQMSLDDPVLQRGLNKLQLLDAICGQVDRHLANIYVAADATGNVTSVQGIDNDMAFGRNHNDLNDPAMKGRLQQYAWRGLPPIADRNVAMAIMNIGQSDIEKALTGLLERAEIDATIARLNQVKAFLNSLPPEALISHEDWQLRRAALAATQTGANSYLGTARNETVEQWFKQNSPALIVSMKTIITNSANVAVGSAVPDTGANLILGKLKPLVADGRIQLNETRPTGDAVAQEFAQRVAATETRDALVHNEIRDLVNTSAQARGFA